MAYTYLFSDLVTNQTLAELPLTSVRFGKKLCGTGQLSATLSLGDPRVQAADPYDLSTPARRVVYVLREDEPVWGGLVWTRRYDSATGRISLGCGDFWSYYDHRKVLPVLPEQAYHDPTRVARLDPVRFEEMDQNDIARGLLAVAARHQGGDIGVRADPDSLSGIRRSRAYFAYQNVSVGDALRKLSQIQDGPDMMFDVGPLDAGGRPSRVLRLGTPRLGQQGTAHVWEFGGNLIGYTWPSDGTRMAARIFADGDGTERATLIAVAEDRDRYRDGWALLEGERGYTGVRDPAELQAHAAADQRAARLPVALPTLLVHGGLPPGVAEIGMGDDARVIVEDLFHTGGLDTRMRVVGLDVAVGDHGDDTVTLTVNPLIEDAV
ncbi:hypothetical protein GCM10010174_22910 [Kutzneria viridogrisea]|uniref:Minor tail protein n=1 Tax=Kutzneria viridogrisea TaxID=47990 RepID=A0ABR6BTG0_9PSEU|nr:hypothetical protein [Kutzneria viridogrisea]